MALLEFELGEFGHVSDFKIMSLYNLLSDEPPTKGSYLLHYFLKS